MESPFIFGKKVFGKNFINRTAEIERLETNFTSGINTIIIAPRRWGKSSLVLKASQKVARKNKNIKFINIDLFKVKSERDLYQQLMIQVLKASSSKWEEWIANAKSFLKGLVSSFSIGIDPVHDFKFQLNWDEP
jgi:AAA+ ATPase superfamily predicted ATPase